MENKSQIGLIGLAVMGSNLARNIASRDIKISVYNRSYDKTTTFLDSYKNDFISGFKDIESFIGSLESPKRVMLMVKAGTSTDAVIESITPFLSKGDIIIDGGNAHYEDTIRREANLKEKGISFLGTGISGGEEGALKGPSIMPGGDFKAWESVSPIFSKIAAVADGETCTGYIGEGAAGHFVKMVHNGIEYADMQLIAETYHLLKSSYSYAEIYEIFNDWNNNELGSFLIEITRDIFKTTDPKTNTFLLDNILDKAGQKGTGKWTVQAALDLGVSIPTINAAVEARILSSFKDSRVNFSKVYQNNNLENQEKIDPKKISNALLVSKILSYAQGLDLIAQAAKHFNWKLNLSSISSVWKGGCIIRAKLLSDIDNAYKTNENLENLILDPNIKEIINNGISDLAEVCSIGLKLNIPTPAFLSSNYYFQSLTSSWLPQNLTQAQRDYFGAHTFERTDQSGSFHFENWGKV